MDHYRLAPVRDARARSERTRRVELGASGADADVSADRVAAADRRIDELARAIVAARAARDAATTASAAVRADRFVARLRRDLDAANDELARARVAHAHRLDAIDAARDRLIRTRAEREMIERHFARWRDAARKRDDRRTD